MNSDNADDTSERFHKAVGGDRPRGDGGGRARRCKWALHPRPGSRSFRRQARNFWGVSHAVGVANGMDAIEIALRALDLPPGQRVLTTPFSAFATTLAILRAGGVPVFVNVDDDGNVNLDNARHPHA